jgi:predicted nuclease with RNAse H fold
MPKTKILKKSQFFLGIDLGGREKKTTGICILERKNGNLISEKIYCRKCQNVFGKDILKIINPYLKNTLSIAIDAPLTKGRGKGKMRLFEKFLSKKIFRKAKINPIPPALMKDLCSFAFELRKKLEKKGFVLDINLIEVFPTLIKKIIKFSKEKSALSNRRSKISFNLRPFGFSPF